MTEKVIVTVNEGKIRGIKKKSTFSGVDYYSFFGVPYGQSTAGKARFKDPVKVKPWKSVFDATTEVKDGCMQYSLRMERFAGSEDCLYNNIHTSKLPEKGDTLKPVIMNIHPGAYFHGTPETWYYGSPDYLMHHDVVYVCVAYRLHVLGFLNLDIDECSGNQGLKDIILSLRWIKENISAFGGDPGNVTVLGSSSGSAITHFLLMSPAAKGLFHKAVLMGMYLFNPTLSSSLENKTEAFKIACNLGYEGTDANDVKKLLTFFKKSDMAKFVCERSEKECNVGKMALFPSAPFQPTPDRGDNAVVPESPEKLISRTARIPIMTGICDKESAMGFIRGMDKRKDLFYNSYRQNVWGWGKNVKENDVKHITEQINSFYFKGNSVESAPLCTKMDVQTDMAYSSIYETFIDVVAADLPSSVFVYKFEFDGNAFTMKNRIERALEEPIQGNVHAADYSYWASLTDYHGVKTVTLSPKSREMVEKFTKLITTFARTGNPNYEGLEVQWKPTTPEQPCYLNINDPLKMVDGKLNGERMKFWKNLKEPFEVTN